MRRRHAGPAVFLVKRGVRRRAEISGCPRGRIFTRVAAPAGEDLLARRDEIWLEPPIAGRPFRRKVRYAVNMGAVAVSGTDRNRELRIPGIVYGEVQPRCDDAPCLGLHEAITCVTRSDHYDYPRAHQTVHLDAERALAAGKPLGFEI